MHVRLSTPKTSTLSLLHLFFSFIVCFIIEGVLPSSSQSQISEYGRRRPEGGGSGSDSRSYSAAAVIFVDVGSNYTLPCSGRLSRSDDDGSVWRWVITRDGHDRTKTQHSYVQEDGSLYFSALQQSDSGLYSCQLESSSSGDDGGDGGRGDLTEEEELATKTRARARTGTTAIRSRASQSSASALVDQNRRSSYDGRRREPPQETHVRLRVRTPPLLMRNVTVLPSTVLASVIWDVGDDGGYPISSFQLRYRLQNESEIEWKTCQPNYISPEKRHIDVFHLQPNSTYIFEMWANNHLGKGYSTIVQVSTHNDQQEIDGKYLLESVETLDTRAWIVAVLVVLATLLILAIATCCLLYKEYYITGSLWITSEVGRAAGSGLHPHRRFDLDGESIELMPNIILNPAYEFQSMMEQQQQQASTSTSGCTTNGAARHHQQQQEPDENLNDTPPPLRVNNNSVIYPARV